MNAKQKRRERAMLKARRRAKLNEFLITILATVISELIVTLICRFFGI